MGTHIDQLTISVEKFSPKLYVHSFELAVALNAIPIIQLNVLPIELGKESAKKNLISASAPDIAAVTELYKKLLGYSIKNNVTATIKIAMTGKLSMSEKNQNVTLKDWILTDVGLSTITSTSAPVLTVVFSHPAVKLDKTGSIYERIRNSGRLPLVHRLTVGSNVIQYMDNLYKKYVSDPKSVSYYNAASLSQGGPAPESQKKVQELRKLIEENLPGKYIKGNTGNKLFLQHISSRALGKIKVALGRAVAPTPFGRSTWQKLITEVCPTQLAQIIPTYDKPQLLLEPCSPWQKSSYMLNTTVIQGMDTVSVDPAPIIGVAMLKDILEEHSVTNDANRQNKGSDKKDKVKDYSYGFYFPKKALAPDVIGEILNIGENEIISTLSVFDMNSNSNKTVNAANGKTLEKSGNNVPDSVRMLLNSAYARAMFLINYRKYCKASVTAIPLFKDIYGKTMYPGRVVTVADGSKNNKLFHGYLVRMLIKGSIDGGGVTYLDLAYARPPDNSVLVDEGTENPCYPEITRDY